MCADLIVLLLGVQYTEYYLNGNTKWPAIVTRRWRELMRADKGTWNNALVH